jgi:hypothetical protein
MSNLLLVREFGKTQSDSQFNVPRQPLGRLPEAYGRVRKAVEGHGNQWLSLNSRPLVFIRGFKMVSRSEGSAFICVGRSGSDSVLKRSAV